MRKLSITKKGFNGGNQNLIARQKKSVDFQVFKHVWFKYFNQ